jgi:hypothetical protein
VVSIFRPSGLLSCAVVAGMPLLLDPDPKVIEPATVDMIPVVVSRSASLVS